MAKPKYEVIIKFKDLEDGGKIYNIGDRYPKPANKKVAEDRLEVLLSSNNKLNKPVIKVVGE